MPQYIENKGSEAVKIYLDTNIIFGFFKSMLQNIFERRRLKKVWKLYVIRRNKKLKVYISSLTLIEVKDNIKNWLSENNESLPDEKVNAILDYFEEIFNFKILENFQLKSEFEHHNLSTKDFIHLETAVSKNLILITDDKKLKEIGREFYQKVIDFQELVKLFHS